jgi:hypothetical protein
MDTLTYVLCNLCTLFVTGDVEDGIGDFLALVRIVDDQLMFTRVRDVTAANSRDMMHTSWGVSLTSDNEPADQSSRDWGLYHDLIQYDGSIVSERPFLIKKEDTTAAAYFHAIMQAPDGALYAAFSVYGGDYPGAEVSLLARRVDPRGAP